MGVESGGGGRRGRVPLTVTNLGGDVPPDSRMKWPRSGVFSDFYGILGYVGHLPAIRPPTQKSVATPLHELRESQFPFVSRIELISSKLSNFYANVSGDRVHNM